MPVMDGYELFRQLKNHSEANSVTLGKVFAFSANAYSEDKEKCLSLGMDGHIAKPFDKEKLNSVLSKIQGNKK